MGSIDEYCRIPVLRVILIFQSFQRQTELMDCFEYIDPYAVK